MASPSDYLVGVTIGEGSYGRVVHARHKVSNRDVAIKVIDKLSIKKQPHLFHSAWTERTLLSRWDSEYVIKLWASFHDSECLYLVMECSTGGDLMHVLKQGLESDIINWSASIPHYGLQIVNALEYVHSNSVIHADLKPNNVLVSNRGRIKLADFGSAVSLPLDKAKPFVAGTADYASPEVLRASKDLTIAVDLWSLGCILYALWVGQSPFHAESDALSVRAVSDYSNTHDETLLKMDSVNDPSWREMIVGLLSPDPSHRIGASDVAAENQSVLYGSIRSFAVWDGVNLAQDPPFQSTPPQWWLQAQQSPMRDGAKGWGAFLL